MESIIINGVTYGNSATPAAVQKLSNLSQQVLHIYQSMNCKPTRYGSYIATVTNEDTDEEFKVYLPKYIADRAIPGKRFIYCGLAKKTDGSGHSYHDIKWAKE